MGRHCWLSLVERTSPLATRPDLLLLKGPKRHQMRLSRVALAVAIVLACRAAVLAVDWQPAEGPLVTRWANDVSPEQVWPEYPRPQMQREQWHNLNGLWQYAIQPKEQEEPESWDGQILVPFAVESALSGVRKRVEPNQRLWYRRAFEIASLDQNKRWLLHFAGGLGSQRCGSTAEKLPSMWVVMIRSQSTSRRR